MSVGITTGTAGGATPPAPPGWVAVWDPFVRLFHWSLVALFVVCLATGDEIGWLHVLAGYALAALVASRVVWGFVGPRNARFASFLRSPTETLAYLGDSLRLRAPRRLGHNPAGGAMIVAMFVTIGFVSVTGILLTTDAFWGSHAMKETHEAGVDVMIGLIFLHLAGVALASFEHGENLVRAMIDGRKRA